MKDKNFNIDEGLDAAGFGRFQWALLALSGVGFFATTIELISVSLLRQPFLERWPALDNSRFGSLMSATFIGELLGGLFWGWLADKTGRRFTFIGTAFMAGFFGCLGAIAPCFYTFLITRFFLGCAIGTQIINPNVIYIQCI